MTRLPGKMILLLRLVRQPRTFAEIVDEFAPSPRARPGRERLTTGRLTLLFKLGLVSLERRPNGRWSLTQAGRDALAEDDARRAKSRSIPEGRR